MLLVRHLVHVLSGGVIYLSSLSGSDGDSRHVQLAGSQEARASGRQAGLDGVTTTVAPRYRQSTSGRHRQSDGTQTHRELIHSHFIALTFYILYDSVGPVSYENSTFPIFWLEVVRDNQPGVSYLCLHVVTVSLCF